MAPYDVVVAGGGPAGSTVAALLARRGRRVLLCEKEKFPRFHIGESLLPYNRPLFAELGIEEKVRAAGFVAKRGAQFTSNDGRYRAQFNFSRGAFTEEHLAWQVERAQFDQLLLEHAREQGVEVWEEATLRDWKSGGDAVELEIARVGGVEAIEASYFVDATGLTNLTATREKERQWMPGLKKMALFAHFTGVEHFAQERSGDIEIVRTPTAWLWFIPLRGDKMSVGLVANAEYFAQHREIEEDALFASIVENSPHLQKKMAEAQRATTWRKLRDFSYRNRQLAANRLLRVGDAAGFIDPIFSSGVYLAMLSARAAAQALDRSLEQPRQQQRHFRCYEREVRRAMAPFWKLIRGFYNPCFLDFLFEPGAILKLDSAVNSILAGRVRRHWPVSWRLRLFFLLVRLQKYIAIVPRKGF